MSIEELKIYLKKFENQEIKPIKKNINGTPAEEDLHDLH